MSHIINIEGCSAGSYTKVRKQLNKALGGPEFWDYDKPMFTVDCSGDSFDALEAKLSSQIDGIEFLADHAIEEVVVEVEPEPEIEPEQTEEAEESLTSAPTTQKLKRRNYWDLYKNL